MKMWIHTRTTFNIETGSIELDEGFWYSGPLAQLKASQEQKDAATQSQNFTNQLRGQFSQQFSQANGIQTNLINRLNGIMTQAQSGQGYSPATLAALQANNQDTNARQSLNATQALQRQMVQQSNGGVVPTGAQAQLRAQILSNGAANTATGSRQIALSNANLANQNMWNASNGIAGLSGQMQSGTGSLLNGAVSNGANSYQEVTQAYQPSNFWGNLATGALSAGLTAVAGPLGGMAGKAIGGGLFGGSKGPADDDGYFGG